MKKIFYLLAIVLVFVSCNKGKDTDDNNSSIPKIDKVIVTNSIYEPMPLVFTYDDKGRLIEVFSKSEDPEESGLDPEGIGLYSKYQLKYIDNNNLELHFEYRYKEFLYGDEANAKWYTRTLIEKYILDDDEKIIESSYTDDERGVEYIREYNYNGRQLVEITEKTASTVHKLEYEWEDGNILSVTSDNFILELKYSTQEIKESSQDLSGILSPAHTFSILASREQIPDVFQWLCYFGDSNKNYLSSILIKNNYSTEEQNIYFDYQTNEDGSLKEIYSTTDVFEGFIKFTIYYQ